MIKGIRVTSRDGLVTGETTGGERACGLEGCTGRRLAVRWPKDSGKGTHITYPCTKGMEESSNGLRIM